MAILATAVWEVDPNADANNGGGYDSGIAGAGTDYSQQTSAELSRTDLAMTQSSTTLTSATGGFTSAMVGNAIYIASGTNFDVGWYFITAFTDENTVTLDRTAATAGNGSGGNGKVGGSMDSLYDAFCEQLAGGNKVWMKYDVTSDITLTEALSIASANATFNNPIVIEGYNTTRGDYPTGSSRPRIACGANNILIPDYWVFKHAILTGTAAIVFDTSSSSQCRMINLKCTNSSGTADRAAFAWNDANLMNCEGISTNGQAFSCEDGPSHMFNCYAHDSKDGFVSAALSDWMTLVNCVAETCSASGVTTSYGTIIANSTFDSCDVGVEIRNVSSVGYVAVQNCSISNCTTYGAAGVSTAQGMIDLDYNNFYNNGTDVLYLDKGAHTSSGNPNYNSAAGSDFTLITGSACLAAGPDGSEIGLSGDAEWNIGYAQNDPTTGGGGASAYTFVG